MPMLTVAMLMSLLPLIETVLKDAPTIIGDIEAIIARVKNGNANTVGPDDAAKVMASLDSELARFR